MRAEELARRGSLGLPANATALLVVPAISGCCKLKVSWEGLSTIFSALDGSS